LNKKDYHRDSYQINLVNAKAIGIQKSNDNNNNIIGLEVCNDNTNNLE